MGNFIIQAREEPYWLLEGIQCAGWVDVLDTERWQEIAAGMGILHEKQFLEPFRQYREAFRKELDPVLENYPRIRLYVDRAIEDQAPDRADHTKIVPLQTFLMYLKDVIEQKEAPSPEEVRKIMDLAFGDWCKEELETEKRPEVTSVADIVALLADLEWSDRNKLCLLELYTEGVSIVQDLRELQRACEQIGRKCLSCVHEQFDVYQNDIRTEGRAEALFEKVGVGIDGVIEVFPNILYFNSLVIGEVMCGQHGGVETEKTVRYQCSYGILLSFMEEMFSENRAERDEVFINTMKTVSDGTRWRILRLLSERPRYVQELARELDLTPATISHHMTELTSDSLVSIYSEPGKKRIYYRVNTKTLRWLGERLLELGRNADGKTDDMTENCP